MKIGLMIAGIGELLIKPHVDACVVLLPSQLLITLMFMNLSSLLVFLSNCQEKIHLRELFHLQMMERSRKFFDSIAIIDKLFSNRGSNLYA
jgi:hypothetical protein